MYGMSPLSTTELQPQSNTLSSLDTVKTRQQEKYLHITWGSLYLAAGAFCVNELRND